MTKNTKIYSLLGLETGKSSTTSAQRRFLKFFAPTFILRYFFNAAFGYQVMRENMKNQRILKNMPGSQGTNYQTI